MADIFVVVYPEAAYNVLAPGRLYYRGAAGDDPPNPPIESGAHPHHIGRYAPARLRALAGWRQAPALDVPFPVQPPANIDFVGRFRRGRLRGLPGYRQNAALDLPPVATESGANPHFLALYHPARLRQPLLWRQNPALDPPPPPAAETQPHFVGRFRPARYRPLRELWSNQALDYTIAVPPIFPAVPPVPFNLPPAGWAQWLVQIARSLNLAIGGKINAVALLTLAPDTTVTTLFDSRISQGSFLQFAPRTPTAAAELGTGLFYYEVPTAGRALVHHDTSPRTDRIFSVLIIG